MTSSHLYFELDFDDGGDDGDDEVVGAARSHLPALERHVDVFVLHERHRPEEARLEAESALLCTGKNTYLFIKKVLMTYFTVVATSPSSYFCSVKPSVLHTLRFESQMTICGSSEKYTVGGSLKVSSCFDLIEIYLAHLKVLSNVNW